MNIWLLRLQFLKLAKLFYMIAPAGPGLNRVQLEWVHPFISSVTACLLLKVFKYIHWLIWDNCGVVAELLVQFLQKLIYFYLLHSTRKSNFLVALIRLWYFLSILVTVWSLLSFSLEYVASSLHAPDTIMLHSVMRVTLHGEICMHLSLDL